MDVVVVGLSHHSSPVTVREKFALGEARIPAVLQLLRDSGIADEAVILSTCNRVEIYAATSLEPRQACAEIQNFLVRIHDYRDPITDELYKHTGQEAAFQVQSQGLLPKDLSLLRLAAGVCQFALQP